MGTTGHERAERQLDLADRRVLLFRMDISPPRSSPTARAPARLSGWGIKVRFSPPLAGHACDAKAPGGRGGTAPCHRDGPGTGGGRERLPIQIGRAPLQTTAPVKELTAAGSVVDREGNEYELEGGAQETLSQGTPKKLVAQFSKGFPKARGGRKGWDRRRKLTRWALELGARGRAGAQGAAAGPGAARG